MDVSLVVRFVNQLRGGAEAARRDLQSFAAAVKNVQTGIKEGFKQSGIQKLLSVENIEEATKNAETALQKARGRLMGAIGQGMALAAPVIAAMRFDQSMKGLEKVLDAPIERLKELRKFALETSTKIPLAAREIIELMSEASQAVSMKKTLRHLRSM